MSRRRTAALALAMVLLTTTAGCGFILGSDSLSFAASPATVGDAALSDSGYEEVNVTDQVVTRNFSAAGQTRQVEVTNQLAQYERQVELGVLGSRRAAVFVTFASPEVSVLDREFNPIAGMSERDILQRFESQYESITVGDHLDDRSVQTLGRTATLERFEGSARLSGATDTQLDVYIHAAKFQHDGDYIVVVAIYPRQLDGEAETVVELTEGLEH